jgi:hypothetical protein
MPIGRLTRIIFALSTGATALPSISRPAWSGYRNGFGDHGGAIAAGVAGGVAGTMAGAALSGQPIPGLNAPANPPPGQNCHWEQRMEQAPYSLHIGQVQVCN